MSKSKAYQSWIDSGYELFAHEGQDGIQIERLARIVDLNKSGFYHYFGDRNIYFEHLMQEHHNYVSLILKEIKAVQNFDPGYLNVMLKFKNSIMVQMQLVRNRHIKLFADTYSQVNYKIDRALLPTWSAQVELSHQPELALQYFEMIRDMFYSRVTFETLHYDFLHNTVLESKNLIMEMVKKESLTSDF